MESKSKIFGIIGTIVFHALLFLLLWNFALRTPLPLPEEQGVEVVMEPEEEMMAGGSSSPVANELPAVPEPVVEETPDVPVNHEEPVTTQVTEESVAAVTTPKQEKPKPVVDPNALYKPKQSGSKTGSGNNTVDGIGTGTGSGQGTGVGDGVGSKTGDGKGDGWFLKGRKKLYLEKPAYNSNEQGIVVVEIIVDRTGKVVRATAGVKVPDENISTTTSDQSLWTLARNAALQSKFSSNPHAPEGQKGYIVYDFIKLHQ